MKTKASTKSNEINRGRAFYALKEGKNVWVKYREIRYKLKSVPYQSDFVIVVDGDQDLNLPNSEITFFVKYPKNLKPKIEVVYEERLLLKNCDIQINCIFQSIEDNKLFVKATEPNMYVSFINCEKGYIPESFQLKHFSKHWIFNTNEDIATKINHLPLNTILQIRFTNEGDITYIGEFIGGEMVYCRGARAEWFNDYFELYGDYEYRTIPIYKTIEQ